MKTVLTPFKRIQKLGAVAFATAFVLAPLGFNTPAAQADPPRYAPAWGWRDRNDDRNDRYNDDRYYDSGRRRDWDRDDRGDRRRGRNDRRDRDDRWDRNRRVAFSGRVVDDYRGNAFVMRTDSGRTITVQALQNGQARRVSRGDRVTVAGYFRGNTFVADDLNFNRDYRR